MYLFVMVVSYAEDGLMEFYKKKSKDISHDEKKADFPEGIWAKCSSCNAIIYRKEIIRNSWVCPKCQYGFRISARERIRMILDDENYEVHFSDVLSTDALNFKDSKKYKDRIKVCKLNVDDAPGTASKYGIMSIPTLIIFKGGQEVDKLIGAVPKSVIEGKIKQYI